MQDWRLAHRVSHCRLCTALQAAAALRRTKEELQLSTTPLTVGVGIQKTFNQTTAHIAENSRTDFLDQ